MASASDRADRPELLVLRALKLGDLLVAVPALRGLRRSFPDHTFTLACAAWLAPLVAAIGGIDVLLPTPGLDAPLPRQRGEVDVAVNLHGSGAESRRLIDALGARLTIAHRVFEIDGDAPADPRMPEWRDDLHERERWVRLVGSFGVLAAADDFRLTAPMLRGPARAAKGAAIVHVGAFYGSRRWPVDRFGAVARALRQRGLRVVYTGSEVERDRALATAAAAGDQDSSVLAGRLDLESFAAAVAASRLVISADTGAAHLASAFGRPSVILFGPASPQEWGPPPGPHIALTHAELRRQDAFADEPDPALLAVSVEEVLAAVERVLEGSDPRPGR